MQSLNFFVVAALLLFKMNTIFI